MKDECDDEQERMNANDGNRVKYSNKGKYTRLIFSLFKSRKREINVAYRNEFTNTPTATTDIENNDNNVEITRDQWTNKIEYMLSVIGYVVDLGNCVRFPYMTYKNGGGAFLIPYFIFLFLIGTPMMYLEMTVGQFYRTGNITLWAKINPYMKGIGIASLLVCCYITLYYATIIAHSVFYFFASFREVMPWSTCNNYWNTKNCLERVDVFQKFNGTYSSRIGNSSNVTFSSPSEEYYNYYMLQIQYSKGIDDLGNLKLDLVLCLLAVYLLMYICIYRGVKGTGKAVYITAVLPYIILVILLIRAVTLEGSADGLYYFIKPTFKQLANYQCWKDAAIQIFFTLGPGISVLTTYASYSKFNNNCQVDAIFASIANVIASFLAGLAVFASLGHLSLLVGKPIDEVATEGMGLSFIAYPEILSALPASTFFSIVFFLMIINLGLDSAFGGLEAIYTAIADEITIVKNNRKISMALIHAILFVCSLPTVTYGGNYLVTFLDSFATSPALMLIVFCEAITVTWLYGLDKFSIDANRMMGFVPNIYWKFCWKFVCPLIIFILFIVSILFFQSPTLGSYEYPTGYIVLGWIINCSVMLPLPAYFIYKIIIDKIRKPKKVTNNNCNETPFIESQC